jgi:hypothetical protein
MLSHVEFWRITVVQSRLGVLHYWVIGRWKDFLEHPGAVLTAIGVIVASGFVLVGAILRMAAPRFAAVISDFQVPKDGIGGLNVTGRTLASLLADEMLAITKAALRAPSNLRANEIDASAYSRLPLEFQGSSLPPALEIEVKGLSWDRLLQAWRQVRRRQTVISGDAIFGPEKVVLAGRAAGRWSWRTEPFAPTERDLQVAIQSLADAAMRDINPFIAGVRSLAEGHADEGIKLLRVCLDRSPHHFSAAEQLTLALLKGERCVEAMRFLPNFRLPWYERHGGAIVHNSLAAVHSSCGTNEAAIYNARQAVRLWPRSPLLQARLAEICADQGLEKEALRAGIKAYKLSAGRFPFSYVGADIRSRLRKAKTAQIESDRVEGEKKTDEGVA